MYMFLVYTKTRHVTLPSGGRVDLGVITSQLAKIFHLVHYFSGIMLK